MHELWQAHVTYSNLIFDHLHLHFLVQPFLQVQLIRRLHLLLTSGMSVQNGCQAFSLSFFSHPQSPGEGSSITVFMQLLYIHAATKSALLMWKKCAFFVGGMFSRERRPFWNNSCRVVLTSPVSMCLAYSLQVKSSNCVMSEESIWKLSGFSVTSMNV